MCFSARYRIQIALRRAIHNSNHKDVEYWKKLLKQYDEWFQVSGFMHPKIIVYTNKEPYIPQLSTWGLVPEWANNPEDIWNKTINARAETIFEKPSFKKSAEERRCLIPAEGFYEHHHYKGKSYPYYIKHKDNKPLTFAGLWSEWQNKKTGELLHTCSIVTTKANSIMKEISNNPKLSEPRMPVILPSDLEEEWLKPLNKQELMELIKSYPDSELEAYTVKKLSGKDSPGNVPEANEEFEYEGLQNRNSNELSLF